VNWSVGIVPVGTLPDTPLSAYVVGALDDVLLDLPCYCWLLRAGGATVLVDTGPDARQSAGVGYLVGGDPRGALLAALRSEGLRADDIDAIVHTHLHQDHMQNDDLFPRAAVIVQRRELETALCTEASCALLGPEQRAALAAGPYALSQTAGVWYLGIEAYRDAIGERLCAVDGEREVFDGITVVPNGGHTSGHQSVLVSTDEGTACLCGDIVSLAVNSDVIGPMTPDEAATRAFLRRLHASDWQAIPSHEPALRAHPWVLASP
jgi:glyoxylase-like metal-dependent hydrolase (beta-lactamase superfamily II)